MPRRSLRLSLAGSASVSSDTASSQSSAPPIAKTSTPAARRAEPRVPKAAAPRATPVVKAVAAAPVVSTSASSIPTVPFATSADFQDCILAQGPESPGLWLKIGKKSNPVRSVNYDQALDVALCCGWIDGQRRPLDDGYFLQRFTPRRKASLWSKRNVDKIAMLTEAGRMMLGGLVQVDAAKADGRWERAYSGASNAVVPADFQAKLDGVPKAAEMFEGLSKAARYPFLYRLETVKKAETRERKINEFVELLAKGKTL